MKKLMIGLCLMLSSTVLGQVNISDKTAGNHPCFKQLEKLCANSDGPDCLKKSFSRLSPKCQEELGQTQAMEAGIAQHCMAGFQKLCPMSVEALEAHGDKYIEDYQKCIKANLKKLPPKCRSAISNKKSRIKTQTIR